jgi:small subunit ribosomal protein S16
VSVKIKLKRLGKKKNPQYRIVVADSRTARGGRSIEEIGIYQPRREPSLIQVDSERAQYWLGVGAQPTEPVMAILKVTGDWQKFKGLPGAEGTLRVAEPKADKQMAFEAAVKSAEEAGKAPKAKALKAEVAPVVEEKVEAAPVVAAPAAAEVPAEAAPAAEPEAEVVVEAPAAEAEAVEVVAEAPAAEAEAVEETPSA